MVELGGGRISDIRHDPQEYRDAASAGIRGAGPGLSGIAPGGAVRGWKAACEKNDDDHGYGALTRGNLPRKGERKTASAGYAVPVLPVDSVGKVSGRRDSSGIFPDIGESTAVYRVSENRLRVT